VAAICGYYLTVARQAKIGSLAFWPFHLSRMRKVSTSLLKADIHPRTEKGLSLVGCRQKPSAREFLIFIGRDGKKLAFMLRLARRSARSARRDKGRIRST
jgi:hypothetical protein